VLQACLASLSLSCYTLYICSVIDSALRPVTINQCCPAEKQMFTFPVRTEWNVAYQFWGHMFYKSRRVLLLLVVFLLEYLSQPHLIIVVFIYLMVCYYAEPSLTRELVCCLHLLLVLASAEFLGSEFCRTRYQILLSQIWDSSCLEGQVLVFISPSKRKVNPVIPLASATKYCLAFR
jgi:hypothetical protein